MAVASFQLERRFSDIWQDIMAKMKQPPYPVLYVTQDRQGGTVRHLLFYHADRRVYTDYICRVARMEGTVVPLNRKGGIDMHVTFPESQENQFRDHVKNIFRSSNQAYGWTLASRNFVPLEDQEFPLNLIQYDQDDGVVDVPCPLRVGNSGRAPARETLLWITLFVLAVASFCMCKN